ncbi:methionine ABC transporter ATP-binding protein [Paenibacillus sp.]|jgi:D-methionine transport system ATP-binding protein|uniref:methionine ABC transporter ATP-binding protein n=1 Tax=Paenibacillus sp. TaxID=58172 RepID=UPI00281F708D|nr:methionine ABC transporter ATP-binding protein [Paenibacillus sp.]MDR0268831.1 methionine ABC transporter ATP-binding protein [Paenibacillus sp.]
MIEIRNLVKEYRSKASTVIGVNHVSLEINKGEIYGIIGRSGAGKSSLLRCINLLEEPTTGSILIDGIDLTKLRGESLRQARLKIGMIFQHFHLIRSKTVFENIAFALKANRKSKTEIEPRVMELLDMVGLADKRDTYPAQLSGGQKQRVGIARALANEPHVLLCDEATSALDPETTQSILVLLKKINRELNLTIVLITHEMEVVKDICDRMAVMQNGQVVEEGAVYDIFSNPQHPMTRSFISSLFQFELPERLVKHCKGTIVKIHFVAPQAEEAIITDVMRAYEVKTNILHGKIEYIHDHPLGILILELNGEADEVRQALDYIKERTYRLEVIHHAG